MPQEKDTDWHIASPCRRTKLRGFGLAGPVYRAEPGGQRQASQDNVICDPAARYLACRISLALLP